MEEKQSTLQQMSVHIYSSIWVFEKGENDFPTEEIKTKSKEFFFPNHAYQTPHMSKKNSTAKIISTVIHFHMQWELNKYQRLWHFGNQI